MSPRASLPGADELFRKTSAETEEPTEQDESTSRPASEAPSLQVARETTKKAPLHDEKVTFYCTSADLTRLERARLNLRADHGIASDRGRMIRAAVAEILDEFESRGGNSSLVRRLQEEE